MYALRTAYCAVVDSAPPVALYTLVHRFGGPVATFSTEGQAQRELDAVLGDEPVEVD